MGAPVKITLTFVGWTIRPAFIASTSIHSKAIFESPLSFSS